MFNTYLLDASFATVLAFALYKVSVLVRPNVNTAPYSPRQLRSMRSSY